MCFGSRKKEEADATRSRELDKIIKADEKRMSKEVKLLLLGNGPLGQPSNQSQMAGPTDCVLQEPESLESRRC